MLAIVAPGQGSQTAGFLKPWMELPGFGDRLSWLSTVAGVDLISAGTEWDDDAIRDTAVAQPLLVAAGLVSLLSLFPIPGEAFSRVATGAGHSVGEITAAAGAGVLSAEQAMVFVRERGNAMARAAAKVPTGMSAVVGGDPEEVRSKLGTLGLTAANVNGAGQIVAAGTMEQLGQLSADPPTKARVIPLKVAGAFHTHHMAPAVDVLSRHAVAISTHDPRVALLSNADGTVVASGREYLARLVRQVSNPVRWDLCMAAMVDRGVSGLIEIPPAGTLVGLAKRAMPGVETLALKTPQDLEKAHEMVARHGSPSDMASSPTWRLVVSPAKGVIHLNEPGETGSPVGQGSLVARVEGHSEGYDVKAEHDGQVVEWLVEEGDPVSPGQPVLRLYPEEARA